ncbi:DEAD/DEAH box helicase family protein [Empedobacter brevis]|uniref:DEAD/DEAH box helicase family protein n=1 Tax=Empedobacter brevis TaxID=247 RepID=UPI0028A0F0B1|nr:DEAD/DEAH box helicase family protein [Empedobacter brevis]
MSEFVKIGDAIQNLGIITRKKYEHLKQFSPNVLSVEDLKQIKLYEENQVENEKNKTVFAEKSRVIKPKIKSLPTDYMFEVFKKFWLKTQKKELVINSENQEIIKGLCAYFGRNEDCTLNQNKGLLITGKCGVGKTSMMMTFQAMGRYLYDKDYDKFLWFCPKNCNDLVDEFEMEETDSGKFHQKYKNGDMYFDDFGTERDASKFGKSNLMKEILEKRYMDLSKRTYITTNLDEEEIEKRYGMRVRDRIDEQFNWIILEGESFRQNL